MDTRNQFYNGMTSIRGIAFPPETRSVLFFGTHNDGIPAYKPGGWVLEKGRQFFQVWAYDAKKLAEVKRGALSPWKVQPYATWELKVPTTAKNVSLGGAAYDPLTGQLFVSQQYADGDMPIIHVFDVGN